MIPFIKKIIKLFDSFVVSLRQAFFASGRISKRLVASFVPLIHTFIARSAILVLPLFALDRSDIRQGNHPLKQKDCGHFDHLSILLSTKQEQ